MAESLNEQFANECAAKAEATGPENLVEFTCATFLCETCKFKGSTKEVILTKDNCRKEGGDPEEMQADNIAFYGTESEAYYHQTVVAEAVPSWSDEASAQRTHCGGDILTDTCPGQASLYSLRLGEFNQ